MHQSPRFVAALALLSLLITSSPARADAKWPFRRIRPLDPMVGALIVRGYAGSAVFRRLVDTLEQSDVIVHVAYVQQTGHGLAGSTQFVTRAGGQRYVRVTLFGIWSTNQTMALIGHELQHAVEVATAEWVVDQATCLELFHTIGRPTCDFRRLCYETDAAIAAGAQVWRELNLDAE